MPIPCVKLLLILRVALCAQVTGHIRGTPPVPHPLILYELGAPGSALGGVGGFFATGSSRAQSASFASPLLTWCAPRSAQPGVASRGSASSEPRQAVPGSPSQIPSITPAKQACREIGLFLAAFQAEVTAFLTAVATGWWHATFTATTGSRLRCSRASTALLPRCKVGSDCGDSVCLGLPFRGDIIAVCAAAELTLPSNW